MEKFFKVRLSNTSRNSVVGHRITETTLSDRDIIRIAHEECMRQGETLEALAGIEWVEQADGSFKPAREWAKGEELFTACEKLGDDGRMFVILGEDE